MGNGIRKMEKGRSVRNSIYMGNETFLKIDKGHFKMKLILKLQY